MKKLQVVFFPVVLLLWATMAHAIEREVLSPTFSHDAQKLAYLVCDYAVKDGAYEIKTAEVWTANTDGTNARRLTSGAIDGNARWSPDGKRIAFIRAGDIWLINADGTGLKQITKTPTASETSPEFANDGKLIFFVRVVPINLAANIKGAEPLIIEGPGVVIAYSLVADEERARFKNLDDVKQIVPNRVDSNEVFLLYRYYDPKAKTQYGDGALTDTLLAAAKLDGGGRRILRAQKQNDEKHQLKSMRALASGVLVATEVTNEEGDTYPTYEIIAPGGTREVSEGSMAFNDISSDGNLIIGVGPVFQKGEDGKLKIVGRSIKIRNATTGDIVSLDKSTLLGQRSPAPTPTLNPARAAPTSTAPQLSDAAKAHLEKGAAAFVKTLYGEAIDEYSKAIELAPNSPKAFFGRGQSYLKRWDVTEAIADFDAAIRLNPVYSEAFLARGTANEAKGENKAALSDYTDAIVYSEHPAEAYKRRGALCRKMGLIQAAQEDEAAALKPENQ
jgi:Tol biopolymer transport system component